MHLIDSVIARGVCLRNADGVRQALLRHADLGRWGMARKRIGILTGGGDVPGLNAIIKTVTYRGSEDDIEVVGLRRGWEALTHLNLEDPPAGLTTSSR